MPFLKCIPPSPSPLPSPSSELQYHNLHHLVFWLCYHCNLGASHVNVIFLHQVRLWITLYHNILTMHNTSSIPNFKTLYKKKIRSPHELLTFAFRGHTESALLKSCSSDLHWLLRSAQRITFINKIPSTATARIFLRKERQVKKETIQLKHFTVNFTDCFDSTFFLACLLKRLNPYVNRIQYPILGR